MSDFSLTLLTAALQVTLAALPAVVAVALAGRRSPRAAALFATLALGISLALTAAAFGPPPPWEDWFAASARPAAAGSDPTRSVAESGNGDSTPTGFDLRRLASFVTLPVPAEPSTPSAWLWLPVITVAGAIVALLRLTAGIWAVAVCRRRSQSVGGAEIRATFDELRARVGCRTAVELRTSASVSTAATLGWWRPVILVAEDLPTWTEAERRAVLAHELAHVRRRDYPAALLAAVCRAVHVYHPLIHWLTRRLREQQELAADALAATAVGSRPAYLVALARMALREERFFAAGVARPFLSDRNSLLRRIAMLRVTEDARPLGRAASWCVAVLLLTAALGASAVRGTVAAPPDAERAVELPPLDLSHIPPSAAGFIAVRPAALCARPEIKPIVEKWQAVLTAALRQAGFGPGFDLRIAEIEQIVGPIELKVYTEEERKKMPNGERHAVVTGLAMIRLTRDLDVPAALRALPPGVAVKEVSPNTFEVRCALTGPLPMTVRVADQRTIVCTLFKDGLAERGDAARWGAALKAVESAGVVQVYDNRAGRWTDSMSQSPIMKAYAEVLGRPQHIAFGLHFGERIAVTCAADWTEEPTDAAMAAGSETILKGLRAALATEPEAGDAVQRLIKSVAEEILGSMKVQRAGKLITAEAAATVRWADLLGAIALPKDESKDQQLEEKK